MAASPRVRRVVATREGQPILAARRKRAAKSPPPASHSTTITVPDRGARPLPPGRPRVVTPGAPLTEANVTTRHGGLPFAALPVGGRRRKQDETHLIGIGGCCHRRGQSRGHLDGDQLNDGRGSIDWRRLDVEDVGLGNENTGRCSRSRRSRSACHRMIGRPLPPPREPLRPEQSGRS